MNDTAKPPQNRLNLIDKIYYINQWFKDPCSVSRKSWHKAQETRLKQPMRVQPNRVQPIRVQPNRVQLMIA